MDCRKSSAVMRGFFLSFNSRMARDNFEVKKKNDGQTFDIF